MSAVAMRRDNRLISPVTELWRCTGCDKVLAEIRGNDVSLRHAGRRFLAIGLKVASQQCDDCQTISTRTFDDAHPS
jgi:hypothetical protein